MPLYDFVLRDGQNPRQDVTRANEVADLRGAIAQARMWASNQRRIFGRPDDFSSWPLKVLKHRGFHEQLAMRALYITEDVRPDDWPSPNNAGERGQPGI